MSLALSVKDQEMLNGDFGPAAKMAMSSLVRMAEVAGAGEVIIRR